MLTRFMSTPTTRLAKAFYSNAQQVDGEVYMDSFGQPYYFHRTHYPADLASPVAKQRTVGIHLLNGHELLSPEQTKELTLEMVFANFGVYMLAPEGSDDQVSKEILNPKRFGTDYRIFAKLEVAHKRDWDWGKVEDFLVVDSNNYLVLKIKRYPIEEVVA